MEKSWIEKNSLIIHFSGVFYPLDSTVLLKGEVKHYQTNSLEFWSLVRSYMARK